MSFIKSFFDDREKSVNPMHVIMVFLVLNSVGWVWYSIIKNPLHQIPELAGIAALLGGGGAANLAHKAEDIVSRFTDKTPDLPKVFELPKV